MQPMTYQALIRTYAHGVAGGTSDTDLNPRERRLCEVMLNLASNAGYAGVCYPPTDGTRDDTVKYLGEILWNARPLVLACSPASATAYESAVERTVEILRAM